METKTCYKCNFTGTIDNFPIRPNRIENQCLKCKKAYVNEYNKARRAGLITVNKIEIKNGKVTCKICKKNKLLEDFPKRKTKHGYRLECKDCKRTNLHKYYQEVYNAKRRERKKTDINYKLKANHRLYIHKCIRKFKMIKSKKSEEYLGCSVFLLKKWLEFQFDEGMTWDNYGSYWTIDHVLPLSKLNLENPKEHIAFNWTNLRPSTDNFVKSDQIRLYEYFNTIISACRFMRKRNISIGYQNIKETLCWLRKKYSGMVKNPQMNNSIEL